MDIEELYGLAMETEQPDEVFIEELFTRFSELRADQQKDIAGLAVWENLFHDRYAAISFETRADFEACLRALEIEGGNTKTN